MGKIATLDPRVAGLVAAGEVVHAPAGVVKELLDNARDAGAHRVHITLEQGGLSEISVADDGCGMDTSDVQACWGRHATSKIKSTQDLEAIATHGFRGEALAAILEAARVSLVTRRAEDDLASAIDGAFGHLEPVRAASRNLGTTVTVWDLFGKMPGRRRPLGTPAVEGQAILRVVRESALADPELSIRVSARGRNEPLLDLPAQTSLAHRVAQVRGQDWLAASKAVDAHASGVSIRGYVRVPSVNRGRRYSINVNGRPVDWEELRNILRPLLVAFPGRPVADCVLSITMDAAHVNPNCTPDKTSVQFHHARDVASLVSLALARAIGKPSVSSSAWLEPGEVANEAAQPLSLPEFPETLFQAADTFLIAVTATGVCWIDQHSVDERIRYEGLLADGPGPTVKLDTPVVVALPEALISMADAWREDLASAGLFSSVTAEGLNIERIPSWCRGRDVAAMVLAALDAASQVPVRGSSRAVDLETVRRTVLRRVACLSAVRAGDKLPSEEVTRLYDAARSMDLGLLDIHGRPGAFQISFHEAARRLGRQMGRPDAPGE